MENITKFISLTSKYPLVYGVEPKNEKEKKSIELILEKLFKFTGWNPEKGDENFSANARAAYRDYEVFLKMKELNLPLKETYVNSVFSTLEKAIELAYNRTQEIMKTNQKLNEFFKANYTMKLSVMKKEISSKLFDYNNGK